MATLNELRDEAHNTARAKGWWDEERTFGDLIALCHSELSEALEEYRNSMGITDIRFTGTLSHVESLVAKPEERAVYEDYNLLTGRAIKPLGIPIELADVLIRVFDMAGFYGIDLDEAVKLKLDYNKTRERRHGNKAL